MKEFLKEQGFNLFDDNTIDLGDSLFEVDKIEISNDHYIIYGTLQESENYKLEAMLRGIKGVKNSWFVEVVSC